jgi:sodium/bile acid cotransporter 7
MACAPTTISSNVVMTRQAHGNAALTVAESALGNVLAPFITPALVRMYLASGAGYTHVVPAATGAFGPLYQRVFKQLGLNMLLPLFVGQLIQTFVPKLTKKVMTDWKLSKLSSVALLMIIWSTYDTAFRTAAFTSVKGSNIILIVFVSIGLYGAWLVLALFLGRLWLNKRDTIAVCYCVPAKTPAMGVPLASAMFVGLSEQTAVKLQIPLVVFQGLQIAAGSIGTIYFRRWARDEEEKEALRKREQEQEKAAAAAVQRPPSADTDSEKVNESEAVSEKRGAAQA